MLSGGTYHRVSSSTPERRNDNIKYLISSSGNRTQNLEFGGKRGALPTYSVTCGIQREAEKILYMKGNIKRLKILCYSKYCNILLLLAFVKVIIQIFIYIEK